MISAETRRILLPSLFLLCGSLVSDTYAGSWDLAVVVDNKIDFFMRNKTSADSIVAKAWPLVQLSDLTYNGNNETIYAADADSSGIFSIELEEGKNISLSRFSDTKIQSIIAITFDPLTHTLFWLSKKNIVKSHVYLSDLSIVQKFPPKPSPCSIALDVCKSRVYWSSSNFDRSTIESCNYDGSNRTIIIDNDLYHPVAISIDHQEQKLYWIDDIEGISIKIERSNLDGSEREVIHHNKLQQPTYLTVDRDTLYWVDVVHTAIWSIPKNPKEGDNAIKFISFNAGDTLGGIITRDNSVKINCSAVLMAKANVSTLDAFPRTEVSNNLTASIEETERKANITEPDFRWTTETFADATTVIATGDKWEQKHEPYNKPNHNYKYNCLHGGAFNEKIRSCECTPGYAGFNCEIALCHNYCVYGKCYMNNEGFPTCKCTGAFTGLRCNRNICDNYCLNDAKCSVVSGKPFCTCKNSTGIRCEQPHNVTKICAIYCANAELSNMNKTFCNCTDQIAERVLQLRSQDLYNQMLVTFIFLFVTFFLISIGLGYYVIRLRRRPRIRRRFLVSKGGVTLTSRPQDNPCEITIEDCCNMNVCETPCFEPNLPHLASPRSSSAKRDDKSSSIKKGEKICNMKDDKKALLDNMERDMC